MDMDDSGSGVFNENWERQQPKHPGQCAQSATFGVSLVCHLFRRLVATRNHFSFRGVLVVREKQARQDDDEDEKIDGKQDLTSPLEVPNRR